VLVVLVMEGNGVFELQTMPYVARIETQGVSHGVIQILKQEDTLVAHLAKIDRYRAAQLLCPV
jgi:hypothetical protein